MAETSSFVLTSKVVIFILLSHFASALANTEDHVFGRPVDRELVRLNKEKLSHFRFYWHDIVFGNNPNFVQVVDPINSSNMTFGMVSMIDNPLNLGPKLSSKMVGRAHGFYTSASLQDVSLLMDMNFAFTDGKYNGSSLTILGRNPIFNQVREMSVIGGSGLFRFAKGYTQAKTYKVNLSTRDAIVEYNVYVMHY